MKGLLKGLIGIVIIIIIIIVLLVIFGKGLGLGKGNGKEEGEGGDGSVIKVSTEAKMDNPVEDRIIKEDVSEEAEDKDTVVQINVVEREYYCDNERIGLDQFVEKVKKIEGKVIVEIKDDNAALKTYNELIEKLDEENIRYTENDE